MQFIKKDFALLKSKVLFYFIYTIITGRYTLLPNTTSPLTFMKKLLLLLCLAGLAPTAQAQTAISAGTIQLSGSGSYSYQTSDNPTYYSDNNAFYTTTRHDKYVSAGFNASAGYFVAHNLVVGLAGGYNSNRRQSMFDQQSVYWADNDYLTSQVGASAFAQYYHFFTDRFGLTGTLSIGVSHYYQRYWPGGTNSTRGNSLNSSLTPSLFFFPVPRFAFGASLGSLSYSQGSSTGEFPLTGKSTGSSFGANFGLSYLALSGTYFLHRKS